MSPHFALGIVNNSDIRETNDIYDVILLEDSRDSYLLEPYS
jgi:hypothetical protein